MWGRWTWACLACRPALAVFSAVYRFIECAGSKRFVLWRSAARELRVLMGLAPLLFSCTSAPWFDRVVATDASSAGQGVVAAKSDVADSVTSAEQAADLAESADWRVIVSAPWRRAEHIACSRAAVLYDEQLKGFFFRQHRAVHAALGEH